MNLVRPRTVSANVRKADQAAATTEIIQHRASDPMGQNLPETFSPQNPKTNGQNRPLAARTATRDRFGGQASGNGTNGIRKLQVLSQTVAKPGKFETLSLKSAFSALNS